ncbi:hypothetical protein BuS5_02998 [Desulfosarcina sp. BuS5]|uniref:hypothetical protein n=1 Tax=Desulfosarcina sp. BuS5 TaxID=933262 RepID=UPI000483FAF0|nr:hypothetical protein [Desulfosarcina sp. BuS5]WDN90028.1 hypothetical protein BuS5_02998 [Desulfosarcina sp. BuS5]
MDLQNIYSPVSSAGRVKVIKQQQSNSQGRRFAKEFRKKREDKKKEYTLIMSEDINASAKVQDKSHKNKDHDENEGKSSSCNGGVIDIKI